MGKMVEREDFFELDDGGYSPHRIYTRASDGKGHNYTYHVAVPKDWAPTVSALIQSKTVPQYRTINDFIRDAIVHRLKFIGDEYDSADAKQLAEQEVALVNIERIENERTNHRHQIKKINAQLSEIESDKDAHALDEMLLEVLRIANNVREPFKSEYFRLLHMFMTPEFKAMYVDGGVEG